MNRKIELKKTFYLLLLAFALSSCESLLHYSGNVYNLQNEPVQDAKISLIIGRIDTVQKMGEVLDTISVEQRKELRKKGIKDHLTFNIHRQMSEPIALYTDKNGYFKTRTIWFGCIFKCPDYKILVQKGDVIKVFPLKSEIKKDSLLLNFRSRRETALSLFL